MIIASYSNTCFLDSSIFSTCNHVPSLLIAFKMSELSTEFAQQIFFTWHSNAMTNTNNSVFYCVLFCNSMLCHYCINRNISTTFPFWNQLSEFVMYDMMVIQVKVCPSWNKWSCSCCISWIKVTQTAASFLVQPWGHTGWENLTTLC